MDLSVYLDASILVALFTDDPHSARADGFLRARKTPVLVSDFAAAEFASAISRQVRMGRLPEAGARAALADFDAWCAPAAKFEEVKPADIVAATAFLRRLDLSLRTPDAINIAIAQRLGATLATLDRKMAADAEKLGLRSPSL